MWDNYHGTYFRYVNNLDHKQFERAVKGYDRLHSSLLPQDRAAKILDIGCGSGHFLYYLKQKGYSEYYGIDISTDQLEFVKRNVTESVELVDVFEFLRDKLDEFDTVVANDFIAHLPREQTLEFLNLVHQCLKLGGRIILKTGNMNAILALSLRYRDFTHETGFTDTSLAQVLRIANFKEVQVLPIKSKLGGFYSLFARFLYLMCGEYPPKCLSYRMLGTGVKPSV